MLRFLRRHDKEATERAAGKTRQMWFGRIGLLFRSRALSDSLWDELEELLISADVGIAPARRLIETVREGVRRERVTDADAALDLLRAEMARVLDVDARRDFLTAVEPPLVVLMVGVNGVGKTTSIAKLAHLLQQEGRKVVLGAADTFRAAAVEQLQAWGQRLAVDVVAHRPGADPGAVAFDTLQAARSRGADVAIIDTAGRLHTKTNLMEEMKKVHRVLGRQLDPGSQRVILALDATTGQNGLAQARAFADAIPCDGVFLAKLDGTAKGGIVLAIAHDLRLPVLFIGTGEELDDIATFDAKEFVDALLGPRS